MKYIKLLIALALLSVLTIPVPGAKAATATVKGYVVDSACAFVKDLKKPVSTDCAVACAKAGSPMVLLSDNGTIYLPISEVMPATSQNDRLMEFAGKKVVVTGRVFVKGGAHAIVIGKIEAAEAAR